MLYRSLLTKALEDKRADFKSFDRAWRDDVREYAGRLRRLGRKASAAVRLETEAEAAPGALPSDELDRMASMVVPFTERWRNHEEARRWAIEALQERVTFAADGSQLLPGREISMPVAAVQVAWFENPHTREGQYRKQADFSIVSPAEFLEGADDNIGADTVVSFRRFQLEIETLTRFLQSRRGWRERGERTPLAFYDGSLLISFGLPQTKIQAAYINAVVELVRVSRETQTPVVGFIDQSYARDLVRLLDTLELSGARRSRSLYDAQLLHAIIEDGPPLLPDWGMRTAFCYCLREGLSNHFVDERHQPLIGFTYLQTTGDGPPARLDVPSWVYEAGLLDDVVDAVRGECVSGLGYPYAIETADAAAVITSRDREQFLRLIQEFAEKESFAFRVSRKAASKVRRR
ncbi:MAG: hypothetical protein QOF02_1456 [Blastocatellia bacterium]|jgi:hypothetical protein|nr:hypothetical protein [Blastocatellia bacterium]